MSKITSVFDFNFVRQKPDFFKVLMFSFPQKMQLVIHTENLRNWFFYSIRYICDAAYLLF